MRRNNELQRAFERRTTGTTSTMGSLGVARRRATLTSECFFVNTQCVMRAVCVCLHVLLVSVSSMCLPHHLLLARSLLAAVRSTRSCTEPSSVSKQTQIPLQSCQALHSHSLWKSMDRGGHSHLERGSLCQSSRPTRTRQTHPSLLVDLVRCF